MVAVLVVAILGCGNGCGGNNSGGSFCATFVVAMLVMAISAVAFFVLTLSSGCNIRSWQQ